MIDLNIDETAAGAVLRVRVQPGAKREGLSGIHDGALKVAVRTPPVAGAANAALLKMLAQQFAIPKRSLEIISGHTSRSKRVLLAEVSGVELRRRVAELMSS